MIKKEQNSKFIPYLLVFLQFTTLFGIMFTGPLFASGYILISIQIVGIILGSWAIIAMRIGNFNIAPIPVENGILRKTGPYQFIRHPMYSSILLFALPELLNHFTFLRLLLYCILFIGLIVKLRFEEKRLIEKHHDYSDYMIKTKRLIPCVY